MITAQLPRIRLALACRQTAFVVASTAHRLRVVNLAIAPQSLIVGMAQPEFCCRAVAGSGEADG
jgi:hypothetical protein